MSYKCEIREQPCQPTLSVRTRTTVQALPQELGKVYQGIVQYLGELGKSPAGIPFAAYYNMDMQNLDVEIGFPVSAKLAGKGEIQPSEIRGGKHVTCLHVGPYDQVGLAYEALTQFAQDKGYEPTGVAYEFYLSDPQTPPQEIKTQIAFPLKTR